jgi:hypothetical protein
MQGVRRYPAGLDDLVPGFCDRIPKVLNTGVPPIHPRWANGSFLFIQWGEMGNDEGGVAIEIDANPEGNLIRPDVDLQD